MSVTAPPLCAGRGCVRSSAIAGGFALNSSASSSASPHVQFLHAFFRRGCDPSVGSHTGAGRCLSAGVSRESASICGVAGELRAHNAFFFAGSVFLRFGSGTDGAEDIAAVIGVCAESREASRVAGDMIIKSKESCQLVIGITGSSSDDLRFFGPDIATLYY